MENKKIIIQLAKQERYYTRCYHDFIDCKLLTGEEKIIFLVLKRFLNVKTNNGDVYPTIQTIQEMTGWSKKTVVKYIKSLEQKGIVKKTRQGLNKPNIYILSDYPEIWACESIDDMKAIADNESIKPLTPAEHIAELERMGYKVEIKEKKLVSNAAQSIDTSTYKSNLNNDTTNEPESQERYSMENIKALYGYDSLIIQYPAKQKDIDIVFDILYESLNSTKQTIRIGREDKPGMVVIGKLMKLQPDDLIYSIDKFHQQTGRIKNVKGYLLTILFNSHEQNHLDLMNLGHHNGDF